MRLFFKGVMNMGSKHIFPKTIFLYIITVMPHNDRFTNYIFAKTRNGSEPRSILGYTFPVRSLANYQVRYEENESEMEKKNAYWLLEGKPEGKRPLVRPRRRCKDNIKMGIKEI
jgi:hypothetical protein